MIRYAYGSFLSNYQKVIAKRVDWVGWQILS